MVIESNKVTYFGARVACLGGLDWKSEDTGCVGWHIILTKETSLILSCSINNILDLNKLDF